MILVSDKSTQKTYYFPKEKNSGKAAFLKLFSHLSKNEYLFNVSGSAVLDLYYALSPDFSDVPNGEYDYTIYDAENNVLQNGLLRIGEYDAGDIIYDFKEEYIVYNPETGESEIIEYGDCTDAVNEAYRSGYTSGYADGYEEGSESGTGGYESGYTSGYTDGFNSGYNSGHSKGLEEGFEYGYESGFTGGYGSGTTDGFNSGYSSGKTDGLKEGFDNGVVSGFSGGYTSGYTDGYSSGYTEGYEDAYDSGLQVGIESGKTIGFESGWTNGYSSGYTDGYSSGWTDGYISGSTPTPTPPTSGFESMYFTIQPLYDGNISWDAPNLSYRIDNGSWMPMSGTVAVERGQEIQFKGTNTCYSGYTITANFGFDVYGNIMSLVYGDNFENQTILTEDSEFYYLFRNKLIRNAENLILPATTLSTRCYESMFEGCRALLTPPALPATSLANNCYGDMFYNCGNLISAPALPATTLAERCYQSMFYGCTSLVEAPELPATTLVQSCYSSMFRNCTSLAEAPALPATTLAERCYQSMFYGCTSLVEAPELPATTLNYYCYVYMFDGCTNLNYIKCLATDISATYCTRDWTNGVASAGTFVKAEEMSGWTVDSPNGIPVGWTVENDNPTDYSKKRFSVEMLEDGDINWEAPNLYYDIIRNGQRDVGYQLYHSIDGLLAGDVVEFYVNADNPVSFNNKILTATGRHNVFGNIMSLLYASFEDAVVIPSNYEFESLFNGNTKLINAENLVLPATTLKQSCYRNMFYNCGNLISAPALPATTLVATCYESMFAYCTSLVEAPELPATDITASSCYKYLFDNCSSLNYVKCLAVNRYQSSTERWLRNVSATGTFVKSTDATWGSGDDGIPSGWVINE